MGAPRKLHRIQNDQEEKHCSKCNAWQSLDNFEECQNKWDNLQGYCKSCNTETSMEWQRQNSENTKRSCEKWRNANPQKSARASRNWNKKNPEKKLISLRNWRKNNPQKAKKIATDYYKNNCEKIKEKAVTWRKRNPNSWKKIHIKAINKFMQSPKNRLSRTISISIQRCLKNKKEGQHWENLVGYTIKNLMRHLEKQFIDDMSWENYGEWHIDHKIPISVFNFSDVNHIDFKRCWALSNLQPMWAKDNCSKNARLETPFQPSLAI